jgi:hypothetical protein
MSPLTAAGGARRSGMKVQVESPRQATAEALPEIARLLERAIPRGRPWAPDLEWHYLRNPAGAAWYVNARSDQGDLMAHFAVIPVPALEDARFGSLRVFFSLNTAVDPGVTMPGLMVATARALLVHLEALHPALVLGVANEKSFIGFSQLLGFQPLGRLQLRFFPPFALPQDEPPRALRLDEDVLRWRVARPGTEVFAQPSRRAVLRRIRHRGLPLDAILTVGLPADVLARLALPGGPRSILRAAPRLYAGFGSIPAGGMPVPERLRPSPLEYIFRPLAPGIDRDALGAFLASRRFEFLDFDVV